MGIETKYEYIYYTVLDQDWFDTAGRTLTMELTTERLINAINRKLEQNKDWTLNKLKVDYSQYCDDIDYWIRAQNRHKECPVFIQIENNQPIITTGSGTMFVFYEENDEEEEDDSYDEHYYHLLPDGGGTAAGDTVDGLAGLGGRL